MSKESGTPYIQDLVISNCCCAIAKVLANCVLIELGNFGNYLLLNFDRLRKFANKTKSVTITLLRLHINYRLLVLTVCLHRVNHMTTH